MFLFRGHPRNFPITAAGSSLPPPETPGRSVAGIADGSLVLETEYETEDGTVALIDCMPVRAEAPTLIRVVEGDVVAGCPCGSSSPIRLAYGSVIPWVRRADEGILAVGGPDALRLRTPVELRGEDFKTVADFTVSAGQRVPFALTWFPSHLPEPAPIDALDAVEATTRWWQAWSERCSFAGPWRDAVVRSLITLKALTYAPTGGLVASPTTSLPEKLGGVRNWDYRYGRLRDATFALYALMIGGYVDEARAWRGVAPPGRRRAALAGQDPLRRRGRALAPGAGAVLAAGLREVGAGPDRQRRGGPVPARRVRRGGGRAPLRAASRTRARRERLAGREGLGRLRRVDLVGARRGHLGGARAAPAVHALPA